MFNSRNQVIPVTSHENLIFSSYLWILHQMKPDFLALRHGLYREQRKMSLLEHFQILKGSVALTWVKFAVRLQYFAAEVSEPCTQSHWNLSKKSDDAFMMLLWKTYLIQYGKRTFKENKIQ